MPTPTPDNQNSSAVADLNSPRLLNFALHPKLINKSENIKQSASGWQHFEESLDKLIEAVSVLGVAFSYVFAGGKRSVQTFLGTDVVAVDVDDGWDMYRFAEHELIKENCAFVYTTPSHTKEDHRFRAVFVLPRTIDKSSELTAISRGLTRRLLGDPNTTDAARVWFGSAGCEVIKIGATLRPALLDELLVDDATPVVSSKITNTQTANRSPLRFHSSLIVTDATGVKARAGSIKRLTPILCPFHFDSNPSAFISRNSNGAVFIHCKTCSKTRWMKSNFDIDEPSLVTDFTSFERVMKEIRTVGIDRSSLRDVGTFGLDSRTLAPNIKITSEKYLSIRNLADGLTMVRSPKGSGKTTFLSEALSDVINSPRKVSLSRFEELFPDDDHPVPAPSTTRILLIGHRQALIGDLCARLGLNCYLDDDGKSDIAKSKRRARYGICLDSLGKVANSIYSESNRYNIIVIDESEQVLSHFLSDTLDGKRRDLFDVFSQLISRADKVVALDADLGWVSFITLALLTRRLVPVKKTNPATGKKYLSHTTGFLPVEVYLNSYQDTSRVIEMFPNQSQITAAFLDDVLNGKRLLITSNSKRKVTAIKETIEQFLSQRKVKKKILLIHSENSRSKLIQNFIQNIKTEILKYDVVVTSPSLGTGIDITFENGRQEIDGVYGLFESRVNSHFEIDQQLARVRNPGFVRVWISPQVFSFETEFDVVKDDFIVDQAANSVFELGESTVSPRRTKKISSFLLLATLISMQQRASKNLLRKNFVDYKNSQGWSVVEIPKNEQDMKLGRAFFQLGKKISRDILARKVCNAISLNYQMMKEIEDRFEERYSDVSPEEFISLYRTRLELFYGEMVSEELIEKDQDGRMRSAIREYEKFVSGLTLDKKQRAAILLGNVISKVLPDDSIKQGILLFLLQLTPCYKNNTFVTSSEMTGSDLEKFAKAVMKNKNFIETHLDIAVSSDLMKKPMRYLGQVLKVIGLELKKVRTQVVNGEKIYFYSVDQGSFDFAEKIRLRRQTPGMSGWRFVNRRYGFADIEGQDSVDGDKPNRSEGSPKVTTH